MIIYYLNYNCVLDPMTLVLELDLVCRSRLLNTRAQTARTDRQTAGAITPD